MAGREGRDQVLHGRQLLLRAVARRDASEHGEGRESSPGRTQGIKVRLFPDLIPYCLFCRIGFKVPLKVPKCEILDRSDFHDFVHHKVKGFACQ